MADTIKKVKIEVETDDANKKINAIKSSLKGMSGDIFKVATGNILAMGFQQAVGKVIEFGKESYKVYQAITKQEKLLLFAMEGRKDITDVLIKDSIRFSRSLGVSQKDILSVQRLAVEHELSAKQIREATKAAAGLAAVTGDSLEGAMTKVLGTYEGTIGRLGRLSADFKKLTYEQLRNGDAVDLINEKYGKMGPAAASQMAKLDASIEELKKSFGSLLAFVAPVFKSIADEFKFLVDLFNSNLSTWDKIFVGGDFIKNYEYLKTYEEQIRKMDEAQVIRVKNYLLAESQRKNLQEGELQNIIDRLKIVNKIVKENEIMAQQDKEKEAQRDKERKAVENEIKNAKSIKDLEALKVKYGKDYEKLVDAEIERRKKAIALAEEQRKKEEGLVKTYEDQYKAAADALNNQTLTKEEALDEWYKKEEESINESIKNEERKQEALIALQLTYNTKLRKIWDDNEKEKQKADEEAKKEQQKIDDQWVEDQVAADVDQYQKELEAQKEYNAKKLELEKELLNEMTSFVFQQLNQESEARTAALEKEKEERLASLDDQLNKGLITQKQYDKQKEKLEKELNAKIAAEKLRQFRINQVEAVTRIVISTAQAIGSLENLLAFGGLTPLYVGIAAAQTAAVLAQKPPKYAKGGLLNGPSHQNGGILTPFGELEGGEFVINRSSTQANLPTLQALNGNNDLITSLINEVRVLQQISERPMRSYVVEADITQTQKRIQRIEANASI